MMVGALSKYSFMNAKLRARISEILTDEIFDQLANAPSIDAALALLRNTAFAGLEDTYARTGDLRLAELELLKTEIGLYKGLRPYLHTNSRPLDDALLSQFEVDNLKNAIRLYFDRSIRKRDVETGAHYILYEPILHDIPMDLIVNAGNFDEIAGLCEGTPYSRTIRKYAGTVLSEGSLFRMEVALDQDYYRDLLSAVRNLSSEDRKVALRLIGVEIDLQNISWIIRFKQFYDLPLEAVRAALIPGGFKLSASLIEELYRAESVSSVLQEFVKGSYPGLSALLSSLTSDSTSRLILIGRILEEIKKYEVQHILAGYPFTVGIILAYFLLKNDEMKRIRALLNTKYYGK